MGRLLVGFCTLIATNSSCGIPSSPFLGKTTDYAKSVLKAGQTLPTVRTVANNEELIKVVPKNAGVNDYSPYFMTRTEFNKISKLKPMEIGQRLGLPAQQSIRGAQLGFEVYSISPKPGTAPKVFSSTIAPIEQGAYKALGGAEQTIVPNRSLWTDPKSIGDIGVRK